MIRALTFCFALTPTLALAQADLVLEDDVPAGATPYFEVPFTVPEGTVEIEVRHDDLSDSNILDWGLRDTRGFRGWGGGNTEPAVVGLDAASRSYTPGPIEAGEWAVLIGQALVEEAPARYRVEIFFRTAATLAPQPERAPYEPVVLREGPAWYAGDFHVHSVESGDARPPLDEIATFARGRGLDFVEISDHNVVTQVDFISEAQARHPELLFIPGIEVTTYWGHANAIGAREWVDFRAMSDLGVDAASIASAIEAQGAVLSINHPVLDLGDSCLGCSWSLELAEDRVSAIELQNGAYSVTGALFYRRALGFWEDRLERGAHVAAIGGSDDHRAGVDVGTFGSPIGSPTTMVYADALSAEAIVAGVAAGRTVVKLEGPDDPMIELTAGSAMIGDTVTEREVELTARVTGGLGATLYFVRNGSPLDGIAVDADPFETTLAVSAPPGDADDRWRLSLDVDGDPRVVTSHLYVQATGEPIPVDAGTSGGGGEGCGCRAAPSRSSAAIAIAMIAIAFAARRRR